MLGVCACGQLGEGVIGRREDGERARTAESVDQTGSLDGSDECGVDRRVYRVLDDVLGRGHHSAADVRSFICADALKEVIARAATAMVARIVFFMIIFLCRSEFLMLVPLFLVQGAH